MRAEIISVGTELLLGDILNTNAQYLSQEMASLGFSMYYETVVGDNPERLRRTVLEAKERSDILLLTGGLGPTDDDLTKQTVASAFGDTLQMDEEELQKISSFFEMRGLPVSENNTKQAMMPVLGGKLPNPNGTAPGVWFKDNGKLAILMPGPPAEMRPMFDNEVRPMLEKLQNASIRSQTLRVYGIGESDLENIVRPLLAGTNPTAALYAKTGEVHIRITARAETAEQADKACTEYAALFTPLLGDYIYATTGKSLESTVVDLLSAKKETLATAESCTGGMLSSRITSVPGASTVFSFGACTYANDMKQKLLDVREHTLAIHGAVSPQVAAQMAIGAARYANASYGVGITGIAGPDGGTPEKPVGLVYIGVSKGDQAQVCKLFVPGRSRDTVRLRATQQALDMVRRLVIGIDIPGVLPANEIL